MASLVIIFFGSLILCECVCAFCSIQRLITGIVRSAAINEMSAPDAVLCQVFVSGVEYIYIYFFICILQGKDFQVS